LRWGVLSTANIGRKAVAPAVRASTNGRLAAVASRDERSARAYANELGIPRWHGSYAALLDDPEVDAIYLPLPNSLHREWTIRALEAGKHVLCEKPLALTAADCEAMAAAAHTHGVQLMEAFMYRFHPRTEALIAAVHGGDIGEVKLVRSAFTFALRSRDDIRLSAELGGGALRDVGSYCVNVARTLYGSEPVEAQAFARYGDSDVDEELAGTLRFRSDDGDVFAQLHCALTLERQEFVEAVGSGGRMRVDHAFLPGTAEVDSVRTPVGGDPERLRFDGVDEYRLMVEHFADAVLNGGRVRYGAFEAAANVRALEALARSARNGGRPEPI
jgi:predicted dehydrogenase